MIKTLSDRIEDQDLPDFFNTKISLRKMSMFMKAATNTTFFHAEKVKEDKNHSKYSSTYKLYTLIEFYLTAVISC